MTLSIRWKITLGVLLAVTLGLAVAGWLALRSIEQLELTRMADDLEARTDLAVVSLEPLLAGLPASPTFSKALQAKVLEVSRHARGRLTVIRPDGRVLAESSVDADGIARMENHKSRPEVAQALARGRGTDIRTSETTGQRLYYLARIVTPPGDRRHVVVVRVALPLTILDSRVQELERSVGIAFGAALLLSVLLSVLLARGLTRPLSDMAAAARRLAAGDLDQRIQARSHDEIGVLAAALNQMTDQLEAKIHEISEDRAQLLAMLTSMVEGVMVLDCRGTILRVNPALERMFGMSGVESKGRTHTEVIRHPELNQLIARVLERRQNLGGEIALGQTGRTLKVEASVAGGQRANEACVVLVFHDISALRRLETVRKDFVANVSHELRTPLTSIKGYVEALLDGAKDDPEQATRFLDTILKQSDRLNLILDDLLQLSQIESGIVRFKHEPVLIPPLVERAVALVKPLADKKAHAVTVAVPPDLPPVSGDEERLLQVLTNLLDNAIKYTPRNGTIQVAAQRVPAGEATQALNPDQLEISVTDTGLGIPLPDRPRVFERFYRVDKARSREQGGTGLGLAIVKHIVEGHSGQVWVEGHEPIGSRFVIRLPVAKESQKRRESPA